MAPRGVPGPNRQGPPKARDLAESNGAEFVVMNAFSAQVPGYKPDQLGRDEYPDIDLKKPTLILRDFCEQEDIQFLDLEPPLTSFQMETGERYYWRYDAHWNENGHRVVAEALFRFVSDRLKRD